MKRRALILHTNPWPLWIGVERDIARRIADDYTVDAVDARRLLGRLDGHWTSRDQLYDFLARKYERFLVPILNGRDITPDLKRPRADLPLPGDVAELRSFTIGKARVGLAAFSSAAVLTGMTVEGNTAQYGNTLKFAWQSALKAQQIAEQVVALGYDRCYLFNGRHAYGRPFVDVLRPNVEVLLFESGAMPNSYIVSDTSHHSPEGMRKLIEEHDFSEEEGRRYFEENARKAPGSPAHAFTRNQIPGLLPKGAHGKTLVTFFSSSVDELFATQDVVTFGEFATQSEVVLALADTCAKTGQQLVVRLHPHYRFKHSSWRDQWDLDALRERGALVIMPADPSDSYALIERSRSVVTCGSTVGLEATYRGKPSAVVGPHPFGFLGMSHRLDSRDELEQFVREPSVVEGAFTRVLAYGSYRRRSGIQIADFDMAEGPDRAEIQGRKIDPLRSTLAQLKRRLAQT